ncbi:MAG TPA: hypothetical protein VLT33_34885, partial [Labilithrix sp.]|nr:hypothetical protein [Labilithrix sp.]
MMRAGWASVGFAALVVAVASCTSFEASPAVEPANSEGGIEAGQEDAGADVKRAEPSLHLTLTGPPRVMVGESVELKVRVQRDGAEGATGIVHVDLGSTPDITAPAFDIPADQSSATVTIAASPNRKHGPIAFVVSAASPSLKGSAVYPLLVRGPAGSVDNGFGTDGVFTFTQASQATGLVVDAGRIFVGGRIGNDASILALKSDGTLDGAFGAAGVYRASVGTLLSTTEMVGSVAKGLFLGATVDSGTHPSAVLAAATAAGVRVPGFGVNGVAQVPLQTATTLSLTPQGAASPHGVLIGGRAVATSADSQVALVQLDGTLNPTIGSGAVTSISNDCPGGGGNGNCLTRGLAAGTDASVVVVCAFRRDGSIVTGTDFEGKVSFDTLYTSLYIDTCTSLAYGKGKLYVGGNSGNVAAVSRYVNGTIDDTWPPGPAGQVGTPFAPAGSNLILAKKIILQQDGTVVVASDATVGAHGAFGVWRLLPDGTTDKAFAAPNGYLTKTVGTSDIEVTTMGVDTEGRLVVA